MRQIKDREDFERWLEDHGWFEDGRVLRWTPLPSNADSALPEEVTLELAFQIEGNYKAGSKRVSRHLRLTASGIAKYEYSQDGSPSPDHWSQGVELEDSDSPFAFNIDAPGLLTLCCAELAVEELPNLVEVVVPGLSERSFYAEVLGARMPEPEEWVKLFELEGLQVAWHLYGGPHDPTSMVPRDDYTGWFIGDTHGADLAQQGLFFFGCKPAGDGFNLHLENHGASEALWRAAKRIVGRYSHATVRCGNCTFQGPEWLELWHDSGDGRAGHRD